MANRTRRPLVLVALLAIAPALPTGCADDLTPNPVDAGGGADGAVLSEGGARDGTVDAARGGGDVDAFAPVDDAGDAAAGELPDAPDAWVFASSLPADLSCVACGRLAWAKQSVADGGNGAGASGLAVGGFQTRCG